MAAPETCPDLPQIGLKFPSSQLAVDAFAYARKHSEPAVYNHAVRSAYWALLIAKKHPGFVQHPPNFDIVVVSCILHDLGWASTPGMRSTEVRFEVDGANMARDFIKGHGSGAAWSAADLQRTWDTIALHATPSIAMHSAPEVALANMGIGADFFGPNFPNGPGQQNLITVEEYHAVMKLFPREGFTSDGVTKILCGLCRDKPETTYDNFVGAFGLEFGLDGHGLQKEEYATAFHEKRVTQILRDNLDGLEALDKTAP